MEFIEYLNSIHPTIKFTHKISRDSIETRNIWELIQSHGGMEMRVVRARRSASKPMMFLSGIYHGTVSSDIREIARQARGHEFNPHSIQLFICDYKSCWYTIRFPKFMITNTIVFNFSETFHHFTVTSLDYCNMNIKIYKAYIDIRLIKI